MSPAVVECFELTKHYFHPFFYWRLRARALTDLSLRIQPGEVFGLLGPNGSGKSTTIKLILGLIYPTRGTVAVFGKPPSDQAGKRRIGYLPEETYLYPYLDAEETLDFYGRLFGLDRAERKRRAAALLELVGLAHVRGRPLGEFSKGMRRRIGLAQCLINDPELIVLDEPTSGLDPIGAAEIKDLIRELRSKGKTVLLSSHLLGDVEDLCDRVTILYGGQAQVTGNLRDLVSRDDRVRITADLDDATLAAIEKLIRERRGDQAALEVGKAAERLEQVFLRTVEEAQTRHIETSGAGAARSGLDFLSQAPADTLERLTEPEPEKQEARAEAPPAADAPGPRPAVLDRLTRQEEPEEDTPEKTAPAPEVSAPTGDPSLLDRLVDGEG